MSKKNMKENAFSNKIYFSIIIPVYNCEKYISECLDSCLEQELPSEEYEIICIDDGSTDQSPQILDAYEAKHGNVKVIHKENGGVSTARNAGIEAACGEYIWFVDADDLVQENVLQKIKNIILEHSDDLFVFKGYEFSNSLTENELAKKRRQELVFDRKLTDEYIGIKFFKNELLKKNDLKFVVGITHGEDGMFSFEYEKYALKTAYFDIPIYYYRIRFGSAMHSGNPNDFNKKRCISLTKMVLYLFNEYKNENDDRREKTKEYLFNRRRYLMVVIGLLPVSMAIGEIKKAKKTGIFEIEKTWI